MSLAIDPSETRCAEVTKRELNQQTAEVLSRVTTEGPVTVTERGVPRWVISEYRHGTSWLQELDRQGRLIHPTITDPTPPRFHDEDEPTQSVAQVMALLEEVNGDRV